VQSVVAKVVAAVSLVIALAGCAACARPPHIGHVPISTELATADGFVLAGCYDCLKDALRAWNEMQLNLDDPAWADIAEAAKLVSNADVPKLTGILALRRNDLPRARDEFQQAATRNPDDCQTAVLLGGTQLKLGSSREAMALLNGAVGCLDEHDTDLRSEIERLQAAGRDRAVEHRNRELASDERLRAQAWYNLAVAARQLGDVAAARTYATRVADDERFGSRARALLQLLK
jgi:tetratricopeptide (TPR) repeat protein